MLDLEPSSGAVGAVLERLEPPPGAVQPDQVGAVGAVQSALLEMLRQAIAQKDAAQARDLQTRLAEERTRQAAEVQALQSKLARIPGWLRRLLGAE